MRSLHLLGTTITSAAVVNPEYIGTIELTSGDIAISSEETGSLGNKRDGKGKGKGKGKGQGKGKGKEF